MILGNVESFAPGTLAWSPRYYPPSQITYINVAVTSFSGVALAIYAIVLTLQLTPSIVAEEREAKRWDLLLTTDLRPREILLGKATARLLLVVEPLLAVLPVFAIMPLLGGLSPVAVALYGVALLALVLSTAAVCVFYSLFAATPQDARGHTIIWMLAYYGVSSAAIRLSLSFGPFWLDVPLGWLVAGNPVALPAAPGVSFEATLLAGLPRFLAFHAGVVLLYGLMACRRLRFAVPWRKQSGRAARKIRRVEASPGPTPDAPVLAATATVRPPMGDDPLAWWTRYGHHRGKLTPEITHSRKRYRNLFVFLLLALAAVYPVNALWPWGRSVWLEVARVAVPAAAWLLTFPLFLRPLFHGAGSIAWERQADTITGVLLMPLTSREIVIEKWRGTVQDSQSVYYFLLAFGLAATLTGFLHPLSLPVLAVVVWPGMMLGAAIGVFFSATATTVARAKRWTALVVFGGGYVAVMLAALVAAELGLRAEDGGFALLAIPFPPATTLLPATFGELTRERVGGDYAAYALGVVCVPVGAVAQALAAWGVLSAAAKRFERSRGR